MVLSPVLDLLMDYRPNYMIDTSAFIKKLGFMIYRGGFRIIVMASIRISA
jgi:hypothetical protein